MYLFPTPCHSKEKGSCRLRGKAGEVRWMNYVLEKVWEKHYNPDLAVHRLILKMLKASCEMERILDNNKRDYALKGVFFPDVPIQSHIYYTNMWNIVVI